MKILCILLSFLLALPSFGMAEPAVQTAEPAMTLTVMCVGDSLTFGATAANPLRDSYPAQMKKLEGSLKLKVLNYGCSGMTVCFATNKPYVGTDQYEKSMTKAPDAVLLMLGTNDSTKWNAECFDRDFEALVTGYQSLESKPTVFVLLPPVRYDNEAAQKLLVEEVIPRELLIAQKLGCPVIDLQPLTQDKPELYSDKLHFTKEGYGLLSEYIYSELEAYYFPQEDTEAANGE